jgi:hypothetical protein
VRTCGLHDRRGKDRGKDIGEGGGVGQKMHDCSVVCKIVVGYIIYWGKHE